ncbi:MAG: hypothetical protein MK207_10265 [Saprospiraceae bacterium]|nr:hypothetical protein [Saprospiraceae bacterium]
MRNIHSYSKRVYIIVILTLILSAVEYLLITAEPFSWEEKSSTFLMTKTLGIVLIFGSHVFIGWVVLFSKIGIFNSAHWIKYETKPNISYRKYKKHRPEIPHEIRNKEEYINARNPREAKMIRKLLEKTIER